jgi:hypothetical protein
MHLPDMTAYFQSTVVGKVLILPRVSAPANASATTRDFSKFSFAPTRQGRALRLLRKLLRHQGFVPTVIVTDKLRSYGAAPLIWRAPGQGCPPPDPLWELGVAINGILENR